MIASIKSLIFENQNLNQTIAKNAFWLFSGQISGRIIRMILIVYAARILGPASWGAFSYAMTLVAFMTIFSDIGVSAIVTRESAKNPEKSNAYFSTALFIKLILLVLGVSLLIFGAPFLTKIEEVRNLLPIIALILIFDSLRNFGFTISRAKEKMQWEGINEFLTNVAITTFGFILLAKSPTSESLATGYIYATGLGFLMIAWQLKYYFKNLFTHFDISLVKNILSMAWPFALFSSMGAIMINTDMIMLGWLRSVEEVGFYSAAQKPILLLYVLPSLFAVSLFPAFSKLANQDNKKYKNILENALKISLLIALPIAIGGVILGDQIINTLFGNAYSDSIIVFQILLATILIIFPSAIINNSIFAYNQQKSFIAFSSLGALGNILFNFLLIPTFGIIGCAISTIITQFTANSLMWIKMKKINNFSIFSKINKMVIASVLMSVMVIFMKSLGINVVLNIIIAIPIYWLSLKLLKEEIIK